MPGWRSPHRFGSPTALEEGSRMSDAESPIISLAAAKGTTPATPASAKQNSPAKLIAELDRRQDALLSEIDELNHKIEAALGKLGASREAA